MSASEVYVERAGAVRIVQMENISYRDRRSECASVRIESLADVAMELDEACYWDIAKAGSSGDGAGAYLEALIIPEGVSWEEYDPSEDDDSERVESWRDDLFSHLPIGSLSQLRKFIRAQKRITVWDGNNHVMCPSHHSEELLAHARS